MMYYSYSFLSAHWALLLTLPSGGFVQVSSTKILKWSDFFPLFPFFSFLAWEILLIPFFAVTKYLPEKNESGWKKWTFFRIFLWFTRNSPRFRTSIFPKILKIATLFLIISNYFFPELEIIADRSKQVSFQKLPWWGIFFELFYKFFSTGDRLQTSIFPKFPRMVRIFLIFLEKSFFVRIISEQVSFHKRGTEGRFFWIFFIFLSSSMGMWRKQVAKRRTMSFNYWK